MRLIHDGRGGAPFERGLDVIVAVLRVALDGEEQVAGLKRARIDGDARDPHGQRSADPGIEARDEVEA